MKRIIKILKQNLKWIILFLCVILFSLIAKKVFSKELMNLDVKGYNYVSNYLIGDKLTPIVKVITNIGGAITLIALTIILFILIKNKKIGLGIAINIFLASLLNVLLKNLFQRSRPTELVFVDESGYSFPSGHSMISMAFYGYLIFLIYKYLKNKYIKWIIIILISIIIILIGISRIYLGVHYTSDVIGGFLFSIAYLITFINIIPKILSK